MTYTFDAENHCENPTQFFEHKMGYQNSLTEGVHIKAFIAYRDVPSPVVKPMRVYCWGYYIMSNGITLVKENYLNVDESVPSDSPTNAKEAKLRCFDALRKSIHHCAISLSNGLKQTNSLRGSLSAVEAVEASL